MTTGRAFRPTAGRPDDGSAAAAHGDADSDAHSDAVISVERLTRVFRRRGDTDLAAVDAMTFSVGRGEAVGYIGANGAGKSTTIKMLTGILAPTSGTARTCGLDPMRGRRELARRIGVVFGQRSQLWWDLPLGESFDILAAIHRLEPRRAATRVGQLIELLDLGPTLAQPVRSLSLGQRMRAEVAAALLHEPELIILDEPTIGLDVLSKARLREFLIAQRREHGTTLLLTTHDMGDIERLCDRVLVVDHGRLAFDGTLSGLAGTVGAQRVLIVDLDRPTDALHGIPHTRWLGAEGEGVRQRLAFDAADTTAAAVLAAVAERATLRDLSIEEPDIEDVVRRIYSAPPGGITG